MRRLTPILYVAAAAAVLWLLYRAGRADPPAPADVEYPADPGRPFGYDADGWAEFSDRAGRVDDQVLGLFLFHAHQAGTLVEAYNALDWALKDKAFREGMRLCERLIPGRAGLDPQHAPLVEARRRDAPHDPRLGLHTARRLAVERNDAAAEPLYAEAVRALDGTPDAAAARRGWSACRVRLGRWREVYAAEGPACFERLAGQLLFYRDRDPNGLEELLAVRKQTDPDDPVARYYRASLDWERKDYPAAVRSADAYLAGPRTARTDEVYDVKFRSLVRLNRDADARAVADDPAADPGGQYREVWRAILAARAGDAAAVLKHLGGWTAVSPGTWVWDDPDLGPPLTAPAMDGVREKYPPPEREKS